MDGEKLLLECGSLRLEITPRPFPFTARRSGRRLLRDGSVWVAEGIVHDQLIHLTEGVIAHEDLAPLEPARYAEVVSVRKDRRAGADAARGRRAHLWIELTAGRADRAATAG